MFYCQKVAHNPNGPYKRCSMPAKLEHTLNIRKLYIEIVIRKKCK